MGFSNTLLEGGDVGNRFAGIVGIDWFQLGQPLAVVRQANWDNRQGHDLGMESKEVADASFQVVPIVYPWYQHNLGV